MAGTGALAAFVLLRGLRVPAALAAPLVFLSAIAGAAWLSRRLPAALDGLRLRRPWLAGAWLVFGAVSLAQTARLSVFMLDQARFEYSLFPGDPWYVRHCCLTAYSESARLSRAGAPNIYDSAAYYDRRVESFNVDAYHYPPPFLLLPLAVRAVSGDGAGGVDFLAVRRIWCGLSALSLMLAIGLLASRLEPQAQLRALAVAPALWCSLPAQIGLQFSNFQILAVSLSVVALVAFPRRAALGGALLATTLVSKIFPGILLVYLLARRRWRDAAWTAAFAVLLAAVALAVLGDAPFRTFLSYEMPRLSSGEAFARPFSRDFAVAHNMSPFGIPLKLAKLGVAGMEFSMGRPVSMVYGLIVAALAFWSARRAPRSRLEEACIWLALLSLGTLASPFAPSSYVLVTLVWLVLLDGELFRPVPAALVWLATSAPFLFSREAPFLTLAVVNFPAQALALGLPALVLWRAGKTEVARP